MVVCLYVCLCSATDAWDMAFAEVMLAQQTRIAQLLSSIELEKQRILDIYARVLTQDPLNTITSLREQESAAMQERLQDRAALIAELRSTIHHLIDELRLETAPAHRSMSGCTIAAAARSDYGGERSAAAAAAYQQPRQQPRQQQQRYRGAAAGAADDEGEISSPSAQLQPPQPAVAAAAAGGAGRAPSSALRVEDLKAGTPQMARRGRQPPPAQQQQPQQQPQQQQQQDQGFQRTICSHKQRPQEPPAQLPSAAVLRAPTTAAATATTAAASATASAGAVSLRWSGCSSTGARATDCRRAVAAAAPAAGLSRARGHVGHAPCRCAGHRSVHCIGCRTHVTHTARIVIASWAAQSTCSR